MTDQNTDQTKDSEEKTNSKSLTIRTAEDGAMSMDFDGEYKLYEIIGILGVTLSDLFVKNFMVPYMNEQSVKIVQHLEASASEGEVDLDQSMKDVSELNSSVKKIMGLVDAFKGIQETVASETK